LEDITSSKQNAEVLRKLRDNDQNWGWGYRTALYITGDEDAVDEENVFIVREEDDLGWLGYFIGRNQSVHDLTIDFLPQDDQRVDAFIEGVNCNRSLREFSILADRDIGISLQNLCSFFRENNNLRAVYLYHSEIGRECARELALALGKRRVKTLRHLSFRNNNLGDEGFADIVQALWTQPQFEELICSNNNIGRTGCMALGALMRGKISNLRTLIVTGIAVGDAGLQALVPGLRNNKKLETFITPDQITAVGLRYLSPFLHSSSCSLCFLNVKCMRLGDEEATALADALKGNKSLETLYLRYPEDEECEVTGAGWSTFSKLLCDTSTINNTYLSNHTLTYVGAPNGMDDTPGNIVGLLKMNAAVKNKKHLGSRDVMQCLTRSKILMSHPDLDMQPLFVYKLKLLPLIMNWFRRSIVLCQLYDDKVGVWRESPSKLRRRELSAVFKFVRDMPLLVIEGFWTNVLNESQAKKQRLRAEKRKYQQMIEKADERIQRASGNEMCALKWLRR
jgi:hypothetical protein